MHIVAIMKLGNMKVRDKLIPILQSPVVERVTLVRHAGVAIDSPKLVQMTHDVGIDSTGLTGNFFNRLHNLWCCFRNGYRLARQERPDLLLGFNLTPYGCIVWLISVLTKTPVAVALIGADFNVFVKSAIFGPVLLWILKHCDVIIVFGEEAREELVRRGVRPARVFVSFNTADTLVFKPDESVAVDTDVIYVGYLKPHKHVDRLLYALKKARESRPHINALIVGDGSARQDLEKLATALGLDGAARFCGWSDDVVNLLRRSRIFVSLAEREGLAMAMLEAMCSGLPAIVTDVGATNSVARDGENGYLIPNPADPDLVAARILKLLEDPAHYQQMRERALAARKTHGYESGSAVWTEIFLAQQRLREEVAI